MVTSTSTVMVTGAGTSLWDVDVLLTIAHTFPGDLDIALTSPQGTTVTLSSDNAGTNDNVFFGTLFDDDANPGGAVPYTTNVGLVTDHPYQLGVVVPTLAPEEALAAFRGEDPNGTWTLTVFDDAGGDVGNLSGWQLNLVTLDDPPNATSVAIGEATATRPIASDAAGVTSSQIFFGPQARRVCDVQVVTQVKHSRAQDVDMTLTSPSGTVVTLTTDNGFDHDDVWLGTRWSDDANPSGVPPYVSNDGLANDSPYANLVAKAVLVPEEALGAFIGEIAEGDWVLTVSDDTAGDGGWFDWSIEITTCSYPDADGDGLGDPCDCGDGLVARREACDDGNAIDGDGCDTNCTPSACGNQLTPPDEQCDDGNAVDFDGCDSNGTLPGCGNAVLNPFEQCDDGNLVDGDGCDRDCTETACGNGLVTSGEACDDGNLVDGDGCDTNCRASGCGNGVVSSAEACDDGNAVGGDGCEADCTSTPVCGDGVVGGGEQCDDGNALSGDGCDAGCTTTPAPFDGCGDGHFDDGEQCDDGNATAGDGCEADCTRTIAAGVCGDGIRHGGSGGGEACDDGNLDDGDGCSATCQLEDDGAGCQAGGGGGVLSLLLGLGWLGLGRRDRRRDRASR